MTFWKTKALAQMTTEEWESLCDGCAKCCLHKLQNEDTDEVYYTDVACRLLDLQSCRCTDYTNRRARVADCIRLTPAETEALQWLPSTCAYRLLANAEDLPNWHHLVSGDVTSVQRAGQSVCGRAVAEQDVDLEDLELRIVISPE